MKGLDVYFRNISPLMVLSGDIFTYMNMSCKVNLMLNFRREVKRAKVELLVLCLVCYC